MIKIIIDDISDEIAIKGLIESGCKHCKEAMETGHGNPSLCKDCQKHKIEFYFKQS